MLGQIKVQNQIMGQILILYFRVTHLVGNNLPFT